MDSTKPAVNSPSANSSSAQADQDPNKTVDSPDRIQINAPAKGEIQIVDVQNVEEIAFNFDLEKVRVSAIDVDLVLIFPDNSKLILPGLAMNLLGSKAPKLKSLNEIVESHDIISSISQVALADTTPSVHLASADFLPKKQGGNASADKASADGSDNSEASLAASAMIVTPVRPTVTTENATGTSANGAKVEIVEAGSIAGSKLNLASASGEPPAPKNPPPSPNSQSSSAAQGNAPFSMKAADLTIKALAITENSETEQSNGKIIVGGSAGSAAADDSSFAAQMERESLAGGSGSDIIYADDPRFSNSGSAARLLDVTVTMPTSSISARQATISGLPVGYSILNANFVNGNWVMPVGTIKPNNFQIQLVYKIPDDSIKPDANGFYDRFTMSISFDGTNGGGGNGTISASTVIGIRDVNAAEDQNFIDPSTGKPVIVLFRRPAGNDIDAGQGDDTIYAAAGADSIDGGDGENIIHYGNSQSGVSVNLAEGKGKGGFAEQDQYDHIQSVIGSKFNDTLIGSVDANTLAGGAGADSLDGGDGSDVADYTGSTAAVTVNLLTGEGVGGDAQGDKLQNIEAVIGSTKDDVITAGTSGSTLLGGQGNDTLMSGAGADSLVGGTGDNLVDYRYSSGGVTVDLKTNTAHSGDAEGDLFAEIENIGGSTYGDSIIGDDSANVLDGNTGDDTLFGGLGNDTLLASGGNDSLFGGAGNDVLVAGVGSSTLIGGDGNDCIIGTGGSDIMRGAANNDYMLIDQSFLGGGGSIDGGTGMDTVAFAANSGNLTLTTANFDSIVTNVEVLDFTSVGTNVTMSLNATDISTITGQGFGTNTKLDIFQNAGDQISIATQAGFTFDTTTSNGVTTYTFYNSTDPHDPANQLAQINVHGS